MMHPVKAVAHREIQSRRRVVMKGTGLSRAGTNLSCGRTLTSVSIHHGRKFCSQICSQNELFAFMYRMGKVCFR